MVVFVSASGVTRPNPTVATIVPNVTDVFLKWTITARGFQTV